MWSLASGRAFRLAADAGRVPGGGLRLRVSAGVRPASPARGAWVVLVVRAQRSVRGMAAWTWRYEDAEGSALAREGLPTTGFPSQADAEAWVGESWRDLLEAGVEQVSLLEDGERVYGPMSLRPVE